MTKIKYLACSCHGNCPKVPGSSSSPNPCSFQQEEAKWLGKLQVTGHLGQRWRQHSLLAYPTPVLPSQSPWTPTRVLLNVPTLNGTPGNGPRDASLLIQFLYWDPTFLCWRVPPLLPGCTACFEVFRRAKSGFNKTNRFGPLDLLLSRGRMWVWLLSRDINTHNFLLFYKDSCSTMCPPLVTVSYFMYPLQQVSLKNLSTFTSFA